MKESAIEVRNDVFSNFDNKLAGMLLSWHQVPKLAENRIPLGVQVNNLL